MLASFSRDFETILQKDEISQDVVYIHKGVEYPLKAVIMGQDINKTTNEGRLMLDDLIAYINLPNEPELYDTIKTDGVEYKVKSWEKQVSRYRLVVEVNKRSTNSHSMGRYR